jgi:predicted ribosomally synthesized six-cysteine peptide SCIFF
MVNLPNFNYKSRKGGVNMKHIRTINAGALKKSVNKPGCKECANSCQSACKTSCTVANLECEQN